jgi:ATP-dependent DNA helicase
MSRRLRDYLIQTKIDPPTTSTPSSTSSTQSRISTPETSVVSLLSNLKKRPSRKSSRRVSKKGYFKEGGQDSDLSDDEFEDLVSREEIERHLQKEKVEEEEAKELELEWRVKQAKKGVNNMKLQNVVMQLRKVCNHVSFKFYYFSKRTLIVG